MNRRGFIGSILALGAAPAIVRADSLMRIVPQTTFVVTPGGLAETVQFYDGSFEAFCRMVRISKAIDVRTDSILVRLDAYDGRVQLGVDARVDDALKIQEQAIRPGLDVLYRSYTGQRLGRPLALPKLDWSYT